jgi:hypothetical protein
MSPDVERTIMRFYPGRALVSPIETKVPWDYDPNFVVLKAVLAELTQLDSKLQPGTRGRYEVSEEVVLFGVFRVQLSYLGPYAALNYATAVSPDEATRERSSAIETILRRNGLSVLDTEQLDEVVPWVQGPRVATLWKCLFQPRE